MSKNIECVVEVDSTTDKKAKEDSVTVVLKGSAYVQVADSGLEFTEKVEVTYTVKCESMRMAAQLGIAKRGVKKVVDMRDRDESLSGYEVEIHPAMQQKIM